MKHVGIFKKTCVFASTLSSLPRGCWRGAALTLPRSRSCSRCRSCWPRLAWPSRCDGQTARAVPGRQLGGERRSAGEKRPVCQRARLEAKREWPPGFLKIQGTQTFISYRDLWVMKATPDTCEKACQDLSPQLPRDGFQKPQNNQRSPCNVQTGNASKSQSFTLKPLTLFDPFKKKNTTGKVDTFNYSREGKKWKIYSVIERFDITKRDFPKYFSLYLRHI